MLPSPSRSGQLWQGLQARPPLTLEIPGRIRVQLDKRVVGGIDRETALGIGHNIW